MVMDANLMRLVVGGGYSFSDCRIVKLWLGKMVKKKFNI